MQLTKPDGIKVSFVLDGNGNSKEIKTTGVRLDGNSESTKTDILIQNTFDNNGQLTETTDAEGNVTRFEYTKGLLTKTLKVGKGLFSSNLVETYDYDDYGNIVTKTDGEGNKTTLSYNEFNN
ncbi:MAG: hypothetical protein PHF46_04280, partial [Candidatus Gracilibacteria bacterium]|nr:hypothetical protein [Candidatus Gracilibacteria bacterium]